MLRVTRVILTAISAVSAQKVIGIDLGTSYSTVGIFNNGKAEMVRNEIGKHTTPSYIAYTDKGRLYG